MKTYRFDEIVINCTAKKKPTESDKETYLGLEHLDPECLEVRRFGTDVVPKGEKLLMEKGDILFGKRRAYQKKVAIAPFDGIFSAHGMVLKPNTEIVSPRFFPFFMSSDYFLDAAIKISVGSLSPTINWSDIRKMEFALPDYDYQEELADTLWAIEKERRSIARVLDAAIQVKDSYAYEVFNQIRAYSSDASVEKWPELKLKQCLVQKSVRNKNNDDIQVLSISNKNGFIAQSDQFENGEVASDDKRNYKIVERDDFAYNPARINVGSIARLTGFENGIISPMYVCFSCKESLSPDFFEQWLKTSVFKRQMLARVAGSVRICLKYSAMEDISIKLPPVEEQKVIADILRSMDDHIEKVELGYQNDLQLEKSFLKEVWTNV